MGWLSDKAEYWITKDRITGILCTDTFMFSTHTYIYIFVGSHLIFCVLYKTISPAVLSRSLEGKNKCLTKCSETICGPNDKSEFRILHNKEIH
jgi:hypothetical protein